MAELTRNTTRWTATAAETNSPTTATKAAAAGIVHCLTGFSVSASAAPATVLTVQLKDGTTVIDQYRLPAEVQTPLVVNYNYPIECTSGNAASITISAGGVDVITTANLRGFSIMGK